MTKSKLLSVAEGLLIIGNCLLFFLLFFEKFLVLPTLFQAMGRLHPLVLHFPIVLILLSVIVISFPFKDSVKNQSVFQFLYRYILLFSALSGILAAIMGLFLAQEEGYSGDLLNWHKWSTAGTVLIVSTIYWLQNSPWFNIGKARIFAVFLTVSVVIGGHFGASLTHGDGFISEPFQSNQKPVGIADALLFDHVILPVLDQKCNSCHNSSKAKGGLDMTTADGVLRGGKTGPIWTNGQLDNSLLFQRIHLLESDKKHMPPKGKPQLTALEIRLLENWIRSNHPMESRIASLPKTDSIRSIAELFLAKEPEESYDFEQADPKVVQGLNNAYRSVVVFAENSPALDVAFFSPSNFSPKSLEELEKVSGQIVSLSLNKMPVQDQDLKLMENFENLNRLNLNFSQITGKGLEELKKFQQLKYLSLAGTGIDKNSIEWLANSLPQLRSIVIWATPLNKEDVKDLQTRFPYISWVHENSSIEEEMLQLNLPQLANSTSIFEDSVVIELSHPIREVDIRYTLDGQEPTIENSFKFEKDQLILKKGASIKAKAYKSGWLPSEVATFDLFQNRYKPDTVILLKPMSRVHPAAGALTFFDQELGKFNANSPAWATNWGGFRDNPLELLLEYKSKVQVSSVGMRILVESSNVIFPPEEVEIWAGDTPNSLRLVKRIKPNQPKEISKPVISKIECEFPAVQCQYLKIIAKPLSKIGDWSPIKGRKGLLLVDELFIN